MSDQQILAAVVVVGLSVLIAILEKIARHLLHIKRLIAYRMGQSVD
jgi:hypothetical protein